MNESKKTVSGQEKGFLSILFDLFRSLKLTIFLLIFLAILSIVGTLIKQNAAIEEYLERYGEGLFEVLDFFSLFDMYHSWWFSAILLMLVVNLLACSIHRLPGILKQVFRGPDAGALEDSMLKALPYVERISPRDVSKGKTEAQVESELKRSVKNPVRIETESALTLFSEKGRFSRLGVPMTHLSILIILIGGLMGSIYGFRGYVNIMEGEAVNRFFVREKDKEIPKPLAFHVRCDDFKVTYYNLPGRERHVQEYASLLTVLENGKEVLQKTIKVNHPLSYGGVTFYQSSYGTVHQVSLGIQPKNRKEKVQLNLFEGETASIPGSDTQVRLLRYVTQLPTFGEGAQVVLFKPNQRPQPLWVLKEGQRLDQQKMDEFSLTLEKVSPLEYTGLQVTKDPGVWVVWIGCGLLVLGLIICFFFSHQRVWVRIPKSAGEIVLAGSANRNRIGFEKVFHQLVERVRSPGQTEKGAGR
jgi:cytochrome c biogenesis protein